MDVRIVAAADDASVKTNRGLWELDESPGDKIPEIYGTPAKGVERIVFAPGDRILHPKEDPALTLYLNRGDDHPLQVQTVYYFGVPTAIGGVLVGLALLLVGRRRARAAPPA